MKTNSGAEKASGLPLTVEKSWTISVRASHPDYFKEVERDLWNIAPTMEVNVSALEGTPQDGTPAPSVSAEDLIVSQLELSIPKSTNGTLCILKAAVDVELKNRGLIEEVVAPSINQELRKALEGLLDVGLRGSRSLTDWLAARDAAISEANRVLADQGGGGGIHGK